MLNADLPLSSFAGESGRRRFDPRATRIPLTLPLTGGVERREVRTEIWVGGGDSAVGDRVEIEALERAWVLDCAGELPAEFATSAALRIACQFTDTEAVPPSYPRIEALARHVASALAGMPGARASFDAASNLAGQVALPVLPDEPPERLYVMCQQGFNRSALVAGRILLELGMQGDAVVAAIREHRRGALSNAVFAALLLDHAEGRRW